MERPEKMDTTPEPSKLQAKILGIEEFLPNDEDIKEALKELYATSTNNDIDSNDLSSDCDSDVEDLESLWDALIRSDEPYCNSIEHLTKLLELLPKRCSTRSRESTKRFDQRVLDKKQSHQLNNIIKSKLVEPDIDEEILLERLGMMRARIKKIIKKKERALNKLSNPLPHAQV